MIPAQRLWSMVAATAVPIASFVPRDIERGMSTLIEMQTELGSFTLALDAEKAPISTANFLAFVDAGYVARMTAYRIVTLANQKPETVHKIEVVQFGWPEEEDGVEGPFPPIAHEPTSQTGLRHKHMTISMARFAPGTAGPAFFICVGDQPELDEGGRRNPDLAGFAAFGQVVDGEATVMALFGRAAADTEYPENPSRFTGARRL